jgi:PqqD family protein of HPr-rel-A system
MQIKKHIAISESGVLFNGSTGDSYAVNPIAADILEMIKNKLPEEEIKSTLLENYEVDPDRLEGDIYDFLAHLRQLNLIEVDG